MTSWRVSDVINVIKVIDSLDQKRLVLNEVVPVVQYTGSCAPEVMGQYSPTTGAVPVRHSCGENEKLKGNYSWQS